MNRTNYDLLEASSERINEDYIKWTLVYFDKGSGKVVRLGVLESNYQKMPERVIVSDNDASSNTETNSGQVPESKVVTQDVN